MTKFVPVRNMMRFLLLGLIVQFAGCSHYPPAAGDSPPDEGWQPASGAIIEEIDTLPSVTVVQRNDRGVVVVIKNIGLVPIEYGARNGGDSITMYREIEQQGKWTVDTYEWCGMGCELRILEPGQSKKVSLEFTLPHKRERLLGSFTQSGTDKQSLVVLAFEPSQ